MGPENSFSCKVLENAFVLAGQPLQLSAGLDFSSGVRFEGRGLGPFAEDVRLLQFVSQAWDSGTCPNPKPSEIRMSIVFSSRLFERSIWL